MKNGMLIGILGGAACVCLIVGTLAVDEERDYIRAGSVINGLKVQAQNDFSMGEIIMTSGEDAVNIFKEYSLDELSEGYPRPTVRGRKTLINVPVINQFPELPMGCEITAATEVLNYIGFDVDKVYMQENFLPSEDSFYFDEATQILYGPDPRRTFAGDPKVDGYGCSAPVITETLNRFFKARESGYIAVSAGGCDELGLETLLDNGVPIIVWASRGMRPYKYTANNEWIINGTNELFRWQGNSHVLVLTGYDDRGYYFADPDDKTELAYYQKSAFLTRWMQAGSQAVIVKKGENEG